MDTTIMDAYPNARSEAVRTKLLASPPATAMTAASVVMRSHKKAATAGAVVAGSRRAAAGNRRPRRKGARGKRRSRRKKRGYTFRCATAGPRIRVEPAVRKIMRQSLREARQQMLDNRFSPRKAFSPRPVAIGRPTTGRLWSSHQVVAGEYGLGPDRDSDSGSDSSRAGWAAGMDGMDGSSSDDSDDDGINVQRLMKADREHQIKMGRIPAELVQYRHPRRVSRASRASRLSHMRTARVPQPRGSARPPSAGFSQTSVIPSRPGSRPSTGFSTASSRRGRVITAPGSRGSTVSTGLPRPQPPGPARPGPRPKPAAASRARVLRSAAGAGQGAAAAAAVANKQPQRLPPRPATSPASYRPITPPRSRPVAAQPAAELVLADIVTDSEDADGATTDDDLAESADMATPTVDTIHTSTVPTTPVPAPLVSRSPEPANSVHSTPRGGVTNISSDRQPASPLPASSAPATPTPGDNQAWRSRAPPTPASPAPAAPTPATPTSAAPAPASPAPATPTPASATPALSPPASPAPASTTATGPTTAEAAVSSPDSLAEEATDKLGGITTMQQVVDGRHLITTTSFTIGSQGAKPQPVAALDTSVAGDFTFDNMPMPAILTQQSFRSTRSARSRSTTRQGRRRSSISLRSYKATPMMQQQQHRRQASADFAAGATLEIPAAWLDPALARAAYSISGMRRDDGNSRSSAGATDDSDVKLKDLPLQDRLQRLRNSEALREKFDARIERKQARLLRKRLREALRFSKSRKPAQSIYRELLSTDYFHPSSVKKRAHAFVEQELSKGATARETVEESFTRKHQVLRQRYNIKENGEYDYEGVQAALERKTRQIAWLVLLKLGTRSHRLAVAFQDARDHAKFMKMRIAARSIWCAWKLKGAAYRARNRLLSGARKSERNLAVMKRIRESQDSAANVINTFLQEHSSCGLIAKVVRKYRYVVMRTQRSIKGYFETTQARLQALGILFDQAAIQRFEQDLADAFIAMKDAEQEAKEQTGRRFRNAFTKVKMVKALGGLSALLKAKEQTKDLKRGLSKRWSSRLKEKDLNPAKEFVREQQRMAEARKARAGSKSGDAENGTQVYFSTGGRLRFPPDIACGLVVDLVASNGTVVHIVGKGPQLPLELLRVAMAMAVVPEASLAAAQPNRARTAEAAAKSGKHQRRGSRANNAAPSAAVPAVSNAAVIQSGRGRRRRGSITGGASIMMSPPHAGAAAGASTAAVTGAGAGAGAGAGMQSPTPPSSEPSTPVSTPAVRPDRSRSRSRSRSRARRSSVAGTPQFDVPMQPSPLPDLPGGADGAAFIMTDETMERRASLGRLRRRSLVHHASTAKNKRVHGNAEEQGLSMDSYVCATKRGVLLNIMARYLPASLRPHQISPENRDKLLSAYLKLMRLRHIVHIDHHVRTTGDTLVVKELELTVDEMRQLMREGKDQAAQKLADRYKTAQANKHRRDRWPIFRLYSGHVDDAELHELVDLGIQMCMFEANIRDADLEDVRDYMAPLKPTTLLGRGLKPSMNFVRTEAAIQKKKLAAEHLRQRNEAHARLLASGGSTRKLAALSSMSSMAPTESSIRKASTRRLLSPTPPAPIARADSFMQGIARIASPSPPPHVSRRLVMNA